MAHFHILLKYGIFIFFADDAQDIEVISNASSDDYCVVPLPACFDPDIPLNSEDYVEAQGPSVERPVSLADELNDERPLESQDQEETLKYEERSVSNSWYGMVWYGMVWCGVVWCGVVWCGMVWYGMVWYGMVW